MKTTSCRITIWCSPIRRWRKWGRWCASRNYGPTFPTDGRAVRYAVDPAYVLVTPLAPQRETRRCKTLPRLLTTLMAKRMLNVHFRDEQDSNACVSCQTFEPNRSLQEKCVHACVCETKWNCSIFIFSSLRFPFAIVCHPSSLPQTQAPLHLYWCPFYYTEKEAQLH